MYERNAIIIERYYNTMFGYNLKNNIKDNYTNYCKLIEQLEKYKNVSEEEEEIIIEYDIIANRIRDIQKKQDTLNKKNIQYQQERNMIFQNIDEDSYELQKSLDKSNSNISNIDEEIKENAQNFISIISEFTEKSLVRTNCGKNRRTIEKHYNRILNETLDNYKNIDINFVKKAKEFAEKDSSNIEDELKDKLSKNGEKEKIPFNEEAIEKAILLSVDIQKRETEILSNVYEKTNKLFSEIKNNTVKMEKHKKLILDSNCKLELISSIKDYLVQFLDNERLATVNGENEYDKLMEEACKSLSEDLIQINNLYALLIKEITRKVSKKMYNDLYNIEYIQNLEKNAEEFENQVKKLKLPVAVINPNHWRIEGMKRIYEIFNKIVIENYNQDLKKLIPIDDATSEDDNSIEKEHIEKFDETELISEFEDNQEVNNDETEQNNNDRLKTEIDKKIDMILGIDENNERKKDDIIDDEEDWDDNEQFNEETIIDDEDEFQDEEDDDDWDDEDIEDIEDDDDIWNDEEDWDDEEVFGNKEIKEQNNSADEDIYDDDEIDYDIWGNNITKNKDAHQAKENQHVEDWENEFINIGKKKKEKKKGFFEKFKK